MHVRHQAFVLLLPLMLTSGFAAHAQVTTSEGASILLLPRVVVGPEMDTRIHLANGALLPAYVRCAYLAEDAEPQAFTLRLDRGMPTQWRVSRGRHAVPEPAACGQGGLLDCEDAGLFAGTVQAIAAPFSGALVCVQLDRSGAPLSGNALRGSAMLTAADGDIAAYEAFGLAGFETNDGDERLCLAGAPDPACSVAEYAGCPRRWHLAHAGAAAADPAAPAGTSIETALTALSCADALAGALAPVPVSLTVRDGDDTTTADAVLGAVPHDLVAPGAALTTSLDAAEDTGFVLLAETRRERDGAFAAGRAAWPATPDDRLASLIVLPYVRVDALGGADTLVQLGNHGEAPVDVQCVYEDRTAICPMSVDARCLPDSFECLNACATGAFPAITTRLRLAAGQTLAWAARAGLSAVDVPGLPDPFSGVLRCAAIDAAGRPLARDVLSASATIVTVTPAGLGAALDAAAYPAAALRTVGAGPDGDPFLVLGGTAAEYEGCADALVLPHVLDGALLPVGDGHAASRTVLALASCVAGDGAGAPDPTVLQFLLHNEWAQRFSTSRLMHGQLVRQLSFLDTLSSTRSIFHAGVAGTLSAQTTLRGIGDDGGVGITGVALHTQRGDSDRVHSAAVALHRDGTNAAFDTLTLGAGVCDGDCDGDGTVTVDELLRGVNIILGSIAGVACPALDVNGDEALAINELIGAVSNLLTGCPVLSAPTPEPTPVRPPITPAAGNGPEISHLGVASAADRPLPAIDTDEAGRPIVALPHGHGVTLVIEARRGRDRIPVGQRTFDAAGGLPDLQIIVSRPLGDGSDAVCDADPPASGGVPATEPFGFDGVAAAAVNDLGCRAVVNPLALCTRHPDGSYDHVERASELQFCVPIAAAWAFPPGDTIVAARVRSGNGSHSAVREIVVRTPE